MNEEGAPEGSELVPHESSADPARTEDLQRAVVSAAAVLRALSENQRALRETFDRAERTELLLKNVQGLNETFRAISTTQGKLLEEIEASRRARRMRPLDWILGAAVIGAVAVAYFGIAGALRRAGEERVADRRDDVASIASAMKEGLERREALDGKLAQSSQKIEELEKAIADGRADKTSLASTLAEARAELETTRAKLESSDREQRELSRRLSDGESSIASLVAKLDARKHPADAAQGEGASKAASAPGAVASRPGMAPARLAEELNALLAFASKSDLRFLELGETADAELRDACLTRYDDKGRPRGLLFARRARLEEAATEPRLTLVLRDGYELTGSTKVPFATRAIELNGVDPSAWRARLPDLLGTSEPRAASAPAPPADPRLPALVERVNRILGAHTDYGRYRLESLVGIDGDSLVGPQLVSLSSTSDSRHLQARRAVLTYVAGERRLEIELVDGTRGRDRPVPFPNASMRLLFPGVDASELEGGEPPLPLRRR